MNMISKELIDKLKSLSPKRTVATGANQDGTHPVPLDLSDWREDLIKYYLFICTPQIMRQMFDIIPHIPYMKEAKPTIMHLEGSLYTGFHFWYPAPKLVTFALGEGLEREYWATNVKAAGVENTNPLLVIDMETKPHHMIGYTSD